ncbi:hypothetical protein MNBD_GAMMA18-1436 [hydrothermal vent metagenome]|uniref:Uncharacterized protein n=1 Tax=hydrothermal vent metagenome TaxID=652676 RepID=A0A3B0Z5A7_9ZZZZ
MEVRRIIMEVRRIIMEVTISEKLKGSEPFNHELKRCE